MKHLILAVTFCSVLLSCTSLHLRKNKQEIPTAYTLVKISGCIYDKTVTEASRELTNISIDALRKEKYPDGISCVVSGSISRPELLEKRKTIEFNNVCIKTAFQLLAEKYEMAAIYKKECFIIEDILEMNNNRCPHER